MGVGNSSSEIFRKSLKGVFLRIFLKNFRIFSEQIVAGNCDIMQHEIKLSDCRFIK